MAVEQEWKYAATEEALTALQAEAGITWREIAMESKYYDTQDRALSARRWTLRLRREQDRTVVCMKTPGTAGDGAHRRGEWEWAGDSVEAAIPHLIAQGAPESLAALTGGRCLEVICGARFMRKAAQIVLPGASAELALDRGLLLGGGREARLCELEVEHKSGDPAVTGSYAKALAQRLGLRPEETSKFQRALALSR